MTNEEVKEGIGNLEFTISMFLFDPMTGNDRPYESLNGDDKCTIDGCKAGIEALEKQIPKKPCWISIFRHHEVKEPFCPSCKRMYLCNKQNYCEECGQKIDWSEEE